MGRALACALLCLAACDPPPSVVPEGDDVLVLGELPPPRVPDDNPITDEKAALGRRLFFDPQLSANGTQACAGCHEQARAFTDGKALPTGSTGDIIPRNSMSLANVAWLSTYTWMNPTLATLEEQALVPMFAEHPVELGMTAALPDILARLAADPAYPPLFAAAFPDDGAITTDHIVKSLATFQRTLESTGSRYDQYIRGDDVDALSDTEKLGMQLFFSETTECYHCHGGPLFTSAFVSANSAGAEPAFQNTGVYNLDVDGTYPAPNVGLFEFSEDPADMGRFRVPTLRNLGFTAPYFHDGSAETLEDVLAHYMAGGRTIADGPLAGVGHDNPHKSSLVRPFELTEREQEALLAFLRALDDDAFVSDERFASPL